jgi:amino acid transporter
LPAWVATRQLAVTWLPHLDLEIEGISDMSDREAKKPSGRQYPPLYEKIVPIALVLIAIAILVILVIVVSVALGLFPGS